MKQLLELFRAPSAHALALRELENAERSLLEALSAAEYARKMGEYHAERVRRLTAYLA